MKHKKTQNVAVAIIENSFKEIFITTRLEGKDFAQSLEFPGGKIEPDETPLAAVIREVQEEINVTLENPRLVDFFAWDYGTKIVNLYVFHDFIEDQEPECLEEQSGAWMEIENLDVYRFVPGSIPIIERLQQNLYQNTIDLEKHRATKDDLADYNFYNQG